MFLVSCFTIVVFIGYVVVLTIYPSFYLLMFLFYPSAGCAVTALAHYEIVALSLLMTSHDVVACNVLVSKPQFLLLRCPITALAHLESRPGASSSSSRKTVPSSLEPPEAPLSRALRASPIGGTCFWKRAVWIWPVKTEVSFTGWLECHDFVASNRNFWLINLGGNRECPNISPRNHHASKSVWKESNGNDNPWN